LFPSNVGVILGSMKPTPSAPDLFSTEATPKSRSEAEKKPAQPLLPKDLTGALHHLDDTELDRLLAAVTGEAERRGRLPKLAPTSTTSHGEQTAVALTRGQLNAVRAAFKAGVKPSAISRQFGISQSDVRKALAAEGPGQMRR
jgi:hypothetical protein